MFSLFCRHFFLNPSVFVFSESRGLGDEDGKWLTIVVISSNTTFSFYFDLLRVKFVSTLFSTHFCLSDRHLETLDLTDGWERGRNGFHAWRVLAPILPTVTKNIFTPIIAWPFRLANIWFLNNVIMAYLLNVTSSNTV